MKFDGRMRESVKYIFYCIAILMAGYHLVYTQYQIFSPTAHLIIHLGFALLVVFTYFIYNYKLKIYKYTYIILLILSMLVTCYLLIELNEILMFRTSIPATSDLIIGTLIIIVLLITNYLLFGNIFTIVTLLAILYILFGRFLPAPFTVAPISFERIIMWLSIELGTGKGVYGDILNMSATYLFLFIFFGGVLDAFGGTRFIIGIGRLIGSKMKAGPSLVALMSSTFLGSITGSTAANITITGTFTIPMMKKGQYTSEQAGAIETVASNGGQIMPPIMGATAFLMAGFANIPYIQIVVASLIPAFLYILCVFLYIYFTVKKMQIHSKLEATDTKVLLKDSPIFIIPLAILIILLIEGYSLPFVGFWSIISIIIIGIISNLIRKDISLKGWLDRLVQGIRSASEIAIICALLGVVVSSVESSGLGSKLPMAIEDLSHGILFVALIITMLSSIMLGIGVPTPAAYMLVVVGAVPALLNMGVPLLSAHMFCFVFAICSHITPPVAVGALVASKLANSNYLKTTIEALKAAFITFLLPFFYIYAPVILLRPVISNPFLITIKLIGICVIVISLQIALSNWFINKLKMDELVLFSTSPVICLIGIFNRNFYLISIGIILFMVIVLFHLLRNKILKSSSEPMSI